MIRKDYSLHELAQQLGFPEDFFDVENLMIVDYEITNDLRPDWVYANGIPCTAGFILQNRAVIFVKESDEDGEFRQEVIEFLAKHRVPLYAFNNEFERAITDSFFGNDSVVTDIRPFFAKYWNKDKFYMQLRKDKVIPDIYIPDPLERGGRDIPETWQTYIAGEDKVDKVDDKENKADKIEDMDINPHLESIALHNLQCLLKEATIFKHRQHFIDHYEINEKGWLVGFGKKKRTLQGKVSRINDDGRTVSVYVAFTDENGKERETVSLTTRDEQGNFHEGSNYSKYRQFYRKDPEVGDIVKVESNTKGTAYYVLY